MFRIFGLFVSLVHELGHVAANLMTGRLVTGVKLRLDHSGTTASYGRMEGVALAWATFWGYPVPALVGAGLLWAALSGWAPLALSAGALILTASLLAVRNGTGLLVILGCCTIAGLLIALASPATVGHFTLFLGMALLIGSALAWFNLADIHANRPDEVETSDAHILSLQTAAPAAVWLTMFAVVIGAAWFFAGFSLAAGMLAA